MSYKILLHKNAAGFVKQLADQLQKSFVEHLRQLENFPQTRLDIIKISGEKDTFRLSEELSKKPHTLQRWDELRVCLQAERARR